MKPVGRRYRLQFDPCALIVSFFNRFNHFAWSQQHQNHTAEFANVFSITRIFFLFLNQQPTVQKKPISTDKSRVSSLFTLYAPYPLSCDAQKHTTRFLTQFSIRLYFCKHLLCKISCVIVHRNEKKKHKPYLLLYSLKNFSSTSRASLGRSVYHNILQSFSVFK